MFSGPAVCLALLGQRGPPPPIGSWREVIWNVEDGGCVVRQARDSIGVVAKIVKMQGVRGAFWRYGPTVSEFRRMDALL